jgi:hypothetical protein
LSLNAGVLETYQVIIKREGSIIVLDQGKDAIGNCGQMAFILNMAAMVGFENEF